MSYSDIFVSSLTQPTELKVAGSDWDLTDVTRYDNRTAENIHHSRTEHGIHVHSILGLIPSNHVPTSRNPRPISVEVAAILY